MARLTFRIRAWFGAAAAALLVAACSSAPQITPSASVAGRPTSVVDPTATASPAPSASASTTPAARPSPTPTSVSATDAAIEDMARRYPSTTSGAEAFVRAYFAALNAAYQTGKVGDLALYSTPGCSRCRDWLAEFAKNEASGLHSQAPFVSLRSAEVASLRGSVAIVVTHLVVPQAKVVNARGAVVHTRNAEGNVTFLAKLIFDGSWRVVATEVPQ
mgnify:CR=1 FL=1